MVTSLGEGDDAAIYLFLCCLLFIESIVKSKKYVFKFLCLPYFRRYCVEASSFATFNFFLYHVKFFLHKLSKFDVMLAINNFLIS